MCFLKDEDFNKLITKELYKLHFNFSYYGTRYLIDSINEAHKLNKIYDINLSKEVFPTLSKTYHKSIDTIHSNIKKSINNMYYDCAENVIKDYFKYDFMRKPTTKEIIIRVLEELENVG